MPVPGSKVLARVMSSSVRRKALLSGAITLSILSQPGIAAAKDIGLAAAKRLPVIATQSAAVRASRFRDIVDTVTAMTDKNIDVREKASDFLFKTGIHESQGLTKFRQVGGGPGRGPMMTEIRSKAAPKKVSTIEDIVQRYAVTRPEVMDVLVKTSGKSREQLLKMSDVQLGDLAEKEQTFSVALGRYKVRMYKEGIPGESSMFPDYWFKYYQGGPQSVKSARINAYKESVSAFDQKTVQELRNLSSRRAAKQTAGLVGVLNNKKVNHNISDVKTKTDHLFKFNRR